MSIHMGRFKNANEFLELMTEFFARLEKSPKISKVATKSSAIVKLNFKNPDVSMIIDCTNGKFQFTNDEKLVPDVELSMTADLSHRFWLGKVSMIAAATKKEIIARGNVNKIIRFLPALKEMFKIYTKLLTEKGRTDLIE